MSTTNKRTGRMGGSARAAQVAIIVLGVYLFLLIAGGLALVRIMTREQEQFTPDYLQLVGRGVTTPTRDYFWFLEFVVDADTGAIDETSLETYRQSSAWRDLAASLRGAEKEQLVARVDLLTPHGDIIMTSEGDIVEESSRSLFRAQDAELIARAAGGKVPARSGMTRNNRNGQDRVYMPLMNESGRVLALLRLELNSQYFRQLTVLRNRLFFGFILASALLVVLWLMLMRLVRRTITAERIAAQADRLRALGTMTAGIAHEIRNPLGIIALQIEELRATADMNKATEIRPIINEMNEEVKRLKNLTEQFLTFSRAGSDSTPPLSPVPVDETLGPLAKMWSKGLSPELRTVHYHSDSPTAAVFFPADRLRQIVLNLLRNADDALGKSKGEIFVRVTLSKSSEVSITVTDTGPGISETVLDQIFDPFFTTRAEGTGLGLSLSRAFAQGGGGTLIAESEEGKGAKFTLTLPGK
ncbi:HAMP domain-containing histidine kinase [Candidatus Sumerlaeota bacterium]|nr:HAMP domain-containing histidine kinase [Candidatus Sumerlaeota bacterium]